MASLRPSQDSFHPWTACSKEASGFLLWLSASLQYVKVSSLSLETPTFCPPSQSHTECEHFLPVKRLHPQHGYQGTHMSREDCLCPLRSLSHPSPTPKPATAHPYQWNNRTDTWDELQTHSSSEMSQSHQTGFNQHYFYNIGAALII